MNYTTILSRTDKVILTPTELRNINTNIYEKLENTVGTCTERDGYVIAVESVDFKTLTNVISRVSGNCIFKITYTVMTLKPEVGHIYCSLVNRVFPQGIFCEYYGIQIIIPRETIDGWSFKNDAFVDESEENTISNRDWVNIKIVITRYDDGVYQCIGAFE
jgi:DNA-directed RNA polymerase subunit E'/Rpb7